MSLLLAAAAAVCMCGRVVDLCPLRACVVCGVPAGGVWLGRGAAGCVVMRGGA